MNYKKSLLNWFNELRQPILLEQSPDATQPLQNGKRDETFDVLKGIAIILMIVGHCEVHSLHAFIHSFHMPLFFFVAGYFLKLRPIKDEISSSAKRLLVPYVFLSFCICIVAFIKDLLNYTWADGITTQRTIILHLLGSHARITPEWLVGIIGACWFVLAMFWARLFTIILLKKIKNKHLICLLFFLLPIVGQILNQFVFVPYCITQGLCASSFVFLGFIIKKYQVLEKGNFKKLAPLFVILWLCNWNQGGVGMASFWYPMGYIFALFGSLGAFFVMYVIMKNLYTKESFLWRGILFAGRYSLIIYCVHIIEARICNWKAFALLHHFPLEFFDMFQVSIRLIVAFLFTFFILKIKPLREHIFQIKII